MHIITVDTLSIANKIIEALENHDRENGVRFEYVIEERHFSDPQMGDEFEIHCEMDEDIRHQDKIALTGHMKQFVKGFLAGFEIGKKENQNV